MQVNAQYNKVTVAILNYNGRRFLEKTINSINSLSYPIQDVILVDDGSTDESIDFVKRKFPDIKIVEMGMNTKMLNKVRNQAITNADTELIFITDNDITFAPDCLELMVEAITKLPDAAVVTPRVMYFHDRERIYIDRNRFHYLCNSIDKNRDKTLDQIKDDDGTPRRSFGCGIMLINKSKAETIGFFDEDYVMGWGDDGEFHHRINLSGMACYAVPRALVYHEAVKGTPRVYGQLRNRWFLILKTYSCKTILIAFPALLAYEVCMMLFVLLKGAYKEYCKAVNDVFINFKHIWNKRKIIISHKVASDAELMTSDEIFVPDSFRKSKILAFGMKCINYLFSGYWKLIINFLK
jgi:GT2 family glycosyltransferase